MCDTFKTYEKQIDTQAFILVFGVIKVYILAQLNDRGLWSCVRHTNYV